MSDPFDIKKVYTINDSHVIIEDTHGSIDHPLRARTQDFYFGGSGHTPNECLIGVIQSMRKAADELEKQVE